MSQNQRKRQREQRKVKRREEKLESKNSFGVSDPTPKNAIETIINKIKHSLE